MRRTTLATLATLICGYSLYTLSQTGAQLPPPTLLGLVGNASLCLLWLFWVTPNRVRTAAFAYAERLLEASITLSAD